MAKPLVVPDASVILKWVLPPADETDVETALALRDSIASGDIRALVPDLWVYEVGNTLARRFPDRAARLLDALFRFDLTTAQRSRRWLSHALELTRRYGVTFCDAAYHAHAIVEQGVFITADARYLQRAGETSAMHLSAWTAGDGDAASLSRT